MAHINLLPWREAQRQRQKKQYSMLLAAFAATGMLIMWCGGYILDQMLSQQHTRNAYLQAEIAIVDTQIELIKVLKTDKAALEQKMRLVEQLQVSRHATPTVFDHLAQLVPAGMTFSSMHRTDNVIEIEGHSDSNNRLATFMRNLNQSAVFLNEELASIKANIGSTQSHSQFRLTVMIAPEVAPPLIEDDDTLVAGGQ